jgi:PD-(D/E)XK nuclease superfamily
MNEKQRKPNLHTSALELLYKCGEAYQQRYVHGRKVPPGIAAIIGGATHTSVEANLKNKMATGKLLRTQEVESIAREAIEGKWNEEVRIDDEEAQLGLKAIKKESIDTTIDLARLHHYLLAPVIEPVAVERPIVIELEGYPFNLAGKIDIQEANSIRDTKTAAKGPNQDEVDESEQLTTYSLFQKIVDGIPPGKVFLDKLVKSNPPKVLTVESVRTEADLEMQMRRFERAIEVIEKGSFAPTNPTNWWCSKKWCGYWHTCPFAKRPVSISV